MTATRKTECVCVLRTNESVNLLTIILQLLSSTPCRNFVAVVTMKLFIEFRNLLFTILFVYAEEVFYSGITR